MFVQLFLAAVLTAADGESIIKARHVERVSYHADIKSRFSLFFQEQEKEVPFRLDVERVSHEKRKPHTIGRKE